MVNFFSKMKGSAVESCDCCVSLCTGFVPKFLLTDLVVVDFGQ